MAALALTRTACILLALGNALTSCSQYIDEEPTSHAVPTNGSVELFCRAPGSSVMVWARGRPEEGLSPVTQDDRLTTDGERLGITGFHAAEYTGLYYCLVTTGAGETVRSCPANVSHARIHHQFVEGPMDQEVTAGSTALLRCRFTDSNPPAVLNWKKDGHPIIPDNERVILSPSGYLYIRDVSQADAGLYQCLADNIVSEARRRTNETLLTVSASPASPSPPRLLVSPQSVVVMEGETAALECATDSPTATIDWTASGRDSLPPNARVLASGTLVIEDASSSDAGHYICSLLNNTSSATDASFASVTVQSPPTVAIMPSDSQSVAEGDALTLHCTVTTTEPVTVVWFKGLEPVQSSSALSTATNTLRKDAVLPIDEGLYQCMAYSDIGCSHSVVMVTVEAPPTFTTSEEPTDITIPPEPEPVVQVEIMQGEGFLRCMVTGDVDSVMAVVWQRDGALVLSTSETNFGGALISFLFSPASGNYICQAILPTEIMFSADLIYTAPTIPPPSSSPSPSPSPSASPAPPVTVTVQLDLASQYARCIVQGDTSTVSFAVWKIDSTIVEHFVINDPQNFISSYPLTDYGSYTCRLSLSSGEVVSDSQLYGDPVTPPSSSPSPSPSASPALPVTVTVQLDLASQYARCIVQGDTSTVSFAVWKIDSTIVEHFVINDPQNFISSYPLTDYGSYTCRLSLSSGEVVSDSQLYGDPVTEHPSSSSPSPSPTPSLTVTVIFNTSVMEAQCVVQGDTSMVTFGVWELNGVTIDYFTISTGAEGMYFIQSIALRGTGSYTCRLSLLGDEALIETRFYDSTPTPETTPTPPPLDVSVFILEAQFEDAFICTVVGADVNHVTEMSWSLDSEQLDSISNPGSLTMFRALLSAGYGVYTCRAVLDDGSFVEESRTHATPPIPSPSPTSPSPSLPPPSPRNFTIGRLNTDLFCHVTLPPSDIESLAFFYDGEEVPYNSKGSGGTDTAIYLNKPRPGVYVCRVSTHNGWTGQVSLDVPPEAPPPEFVAPPTSLEAQWVTGPDGSLGNILVTWEKPPNSEGIRGYKINWGLPGFTDVVARNAVPPHVQQFIIINVDIDSPYAILVWAFTNKDQEPARVELWPLGDVTPSPYPSPTPPSVELTTCSALSATSASIYWEAEGYLDEDEVLSVTYGCETAGTHSTISLPPSSPLSLHHLLPNCRYHIHIKSAQCTLTTPPGGIVTDYHVEETDGSLQVEWDLPPELQTSSEEVRVEINMTGEWEEVGSVAIPHLSPDLDSYTLHIRFSVQNWSAILSIPITLGTGPTATPTSTQATPTSQTEEVVLLYGAVFAVLLLACVVVVVVILLLKYVQITRRDTDKVTDHRLKQKEHLQRMSLERSSSIKKTPPYPHTNGTSSRYSHVTSI